MTKRACLPTSAGVAATRAPSAPALAALPASMSQTVRAWPCLARCFAIASPIRPTPMMPTGSFALSSAIAMILVRGLRRHKTLGHVVRDGGAGPPRRFAEPAARRALQQEALAGLHLDAGGGARLDLLGRAEPHHETGAAARLAARDPLRRKARLVEAADHRRVLQELVFAPQAQAPAKFAGAARVRHQVEARHPAGIF